MVSLQGIEEGRIPIINTISLEVIRERIANAMMAAMMKGGEAQTGRNRKKKEKKKLKKKAVEEEKTEAAHRKEDTDSEEEKIGELAVRDDFCSNQEIIIKLSPRNERDRQEYNDILNELIFDYDQKSSR